MAQTARKLAKPLDPVIACHVDILTGEKRLDLSTWSTLSEEERGWVVSGMRTALIQRVDEQYPGHLVSFTQPRTDTGEALELVEGVLCKACTVKVHAFVFALVNAADEPVKEARPAFLVWMYKALNTFTNRAPEDALADAWAMGFRPKEPGAKDSECERVHCYYCKGRGFISWMEVDVLCGECAGKGTVHPAARQQQEERVSRGRTRAAEKAGEVPQ